MLGEGEVSALTEGGEEEEVQAHPSSPAPGWHCPFHIWAVNRQATVYGSRLLTSPCSCRQKKERVPEAKSGQDNRHFHTYFRDRLLSHATLNCPGR